MKEYLRIMFSDFDAMNNEDWEKWKRYSNIALNVSIFALMFVVGVLIVLKVIQ